MSRWSWRRADLAGGRGSGRERPLRALAIGVAAALAASACSAGRDQVRPSPTGERIEIDGGTATPYGRGDGRVWVLSPKDRDVESVVVYLHGWDARLPFEWHQAWFEHLLERGSAVLFPEYQDGVDDAWVVAPYALRDGLRSGFRALEGVDAPVVAAGFSVGATLAFVYAARAASWGVPAPRSVYGIFPADPFQIDPLLDLSDLSETRVVVLVGDRDETVGRDGAESLVGMLGSRPSRLLEYRVIRTTNALLADHEAPTYVESPAVRSTFWKPLDELVEDAR